jgi:type II secretory pathway pseudopilin PulG
MRRPVRPAFTPYEALAVLAVFAMLLGLLPPAAQRMQDRANRAKTQNNLKQLGLAAHNYYSAIGQFPSGNDANNFSATAYLLPYVEQDNLYKLIDFKKPMDDKANAQARQVMIKTFLSPMDPVKSVSNDYGATNYLWSAGSKHSLTDNDGVFFQNSAIKFPDIQDGTSNTIMIGETLKGDGNVRAMDVKRQHVALKKEALKDLKDDSGVKEFKDDKDIAADRCASWMDGRFLQGTFAANRALNDEKPDVTCEGTGGLSGLRSRNDAVSVAICDGSVRVISTKVDVKVWKALATRNGGEVIPGDF